MPNNLALFWEFWLRISTRHFLETSAPDITLAARFFHYRAQHECRATHFILALRPSERTIGSFF